LYTDTTKQIGENFHKKTYIPNERFHDNLTVIKLMFKKKV